MESVHVRNWRRISTELLFRRIASRNGGEAERLIAPREACGRLGVGRHQLVRLVDLGLLPLAERTESGARRFRVGDVEALVERARIRHLNGGKA